MYYIYEKIVFAYVYIKNVYFVYIFNENVNWH